jgi:endoglycosylceramidase
MFARCSVFLFIAVLLFACNFTAEQKTADGFVQVEGRNFIDPEGRQILFSGINFISKNPDDNYMPPQGEETMKIFKTWGFNCIRLGIIWDGLEPEPGKYNEAYLKEIDRRIQWAANQDIYVFLDMHQDLYGAKYSDGAPDWATLDEGQPHYTGAVWSDSYLISPAVQTAFDNFWKNAPASDGIGIQDHYANLWKHIAERYANNTTVIGYDIMNEPFMGSSARQVLPLMLEAYARIFAEETGQMPPSAEELGAMWADETSRLEALELISTRETYSRVVDAVYELSADFEKNHLQAMYQKVADAIRSVDMHHLLFYNHNYFVNTGVSTALTATTLPDGSRDPNVVYAAHGYDLVVDTKEVENPSYERVEFIFDRIAESGLRMNMPVMVGEWGDLHGKSQKMIETARHLVNLFEAHKFSNTYWAFYPDIANYPYFQEAIIRPYPQFIAGELMAYDTDFENGQFTCHWKERGDSKAPTVIYVPNLQELSQDDILLSPPAEQIVFEYDDSNRGGKLIISPVEEALTRSISFSLRPKKGETISIK